MVGSLIPRAQRVWQSSQHVRFNDSNWLPLIISNFQLLELVFNDPVFILVVHNKRRLRWQRSALSEWCSCWSAPDTLTCMNLQKNCVSSWQIWFHCVTYTKMRKHRRQSLRANKLNMAKKKSEVTMICKSWKFSALCTNFLLYECATTPLRVMKTFYHYLLDAEWNLFSLLSFRHNEDASLFAWGWD